MANASSPITWATATVVAAGTSVSPSAPVPDNCFLVRVRNPSNAQTLLVGIGAPPGALTAGVNATAVPPNSIMDFPIGPLTRRGIVDQTQVAGSGLRFDATGAVVGEVTYFNVTTAQAATGE